MTKRGRMLVFSSIILIIMAGLLWHKSGIQEDIEPEITSISWDEAKPPKRPVERLTRNQMREDLEQLRTDLLQLHPETKKGLPENIQVAYDNIFIKIEKKTMTVLEFTREVARLVAMFQDQHTRIDIAHYINEKIVLPMKFKWIDDKLYRIDALGLGNEIIDINGISILKIYEDYRQYTAVENEYSLKAKFEKILPYKSTASILNLITEENEIYVNQVKEGKEIREIYSLETNWEKPFLSNYMPQYNYKNYISENYCLLTISSFPEKEHEIFSKYMENMFTAIKSSNVNNLIIDIRENPGGEADLFQYFMEYMDIENYTMVENIKSRVELYKIDKKDDFTNKKNIKEYELTFKGNIYCLIGENSASAASAFPRIIKNNKLGILIGAPTANAAKSYGNAHMFQLKNSNILYYVATMELIYPTKDGKDIDACYPDITVEYTIEDYINGHDPVMEETLRLIKSS